MERFGLVRIAIAGAALFLAACAPPSEPSPTFPPAVAFGSRPSSDFEIDHVMLVVAQGAPERAPLEKIGLRFDPITNRHDGQGTASITVELENAFLELTWVEPTVPVAPGMERVVEKFAERAAWRTSGASPVGIALRRTPSAPDALPFPTWSARADWMRPGESLEILTPKTAKGAPTIWVVPRTMAIASDAKASRNPRFVEHALGVHRLTGLRLVEPSPRDPESPSLFLERLGLARVETGESWLVELTLDGGARRAMRDLRPDLPLVLRY